ncbi:hypothetical protein J6590_106514 [Homalodisca vitripennis]|nr:hypothetical protein J6590_106514 [Homalodisca vitripennis]
MMEFYDLNCVRPFGFPDDFAVAAEDSTLISVWPGAVLVTVTVTAINSHSPQIDLSQPLWDVISSDSINSTPKVRIAIDLNGLKTRIKRGLIYFCPLGPMALPLRQSTKGLPNK